MITSVKNPSVAFVKELNKKSKRRRTEGLFVAEGQRLVFDIIKSGKIPVNTFVTEEYFVGHRDELSAIDNVETVSEHCMKAMCDTDNPQGIICTFNIPKYQEDDIFSGQNPLVLILDEIRDPGNMGTIFRSFEAAGGTGIVLLGNCTDVYSPKCIRSTMGSVVRLPVLQVEDADKLAQLLKVYSKFNIYAADMDGEDLWSQDFKGACAFIIGNEANGVSKEGFLLAKTRVKIPMEGGVESLNAAVSAALLSFEALRQRKFS